MRSLLMPVLVACKLSVQVDLEKLKATSYS